MSVNRALVGCKRVIDYATKVRLRPWENVLSGVPPFCARHLYAYAVISNSIQQRRLECSSAL